MAIKDYRTGGVIEALKDSIYGDEEREGSLVENQFRKRF